MKGLEHTPLILLQSSQEVSGRSRIADVPKEGRERLFQQSGQLCIARHTARTHFCFIRKLAVTLGKSNQRRIFGLNYRKAGLPGRRGAQEPFRPDDIRNERLDVEVSATCIAV